ncbi:MAG: LLM class flavin-dependent oxidoreductase [Actinomycetota bacterium]
MRIGVSLASAQFVDDHREGAHNIVERARAALTAELDWLTIGDQHAAGIPYYANVPMMARLLAEWPADRQAGLLFLLPLWHPVLAAEQIGTLATLSDVPLIVQTGVGGGTAQFAAMGREMRRRGGDLDESIRVIKGLLAGETIDSERFGLTGATVAPRPALGVEWWIGSSAPKTMARAAREGDVWYGNAHLTPSMAAESLDLYRRACDEIGATPRAVIRKDIVILDDESRARRLGDEMIEQGYRGFEADAVAYGGVDQVTEQLAVYRDLGFDGVMVRCMAVPQPDAVESLTLAGRVRANLAS